MQGPPHFCILTFLLLMNFELIPTALSLPKAHRKRSHQFVRLKNNLKVLLISDPECNIVAGALLVGSGSLNDPETAQGLAHLCEHMLFMGNKKYPAGLFEAFLGQTGGATNAYTTCNQTCYQFEVSAYAVKSVPAYETAIDMFLSFFISPSFHKNDVSGEVHSIDEEFKTSLSDSDRSLFHAMRLLAQGDFSKFGPGNADTLGEPPKRLRSLLVDYFAKFYVSSNMVLVIKGPQSVNHLRRLIQPFGEIRDGKVELQKHSGPQFSPPVFLHMERSDNILRVAFPLSRGSWVTNAALRLICYLLGDESSGSLCEYIQRQKQWSEGTNVSANEYGTKTVLAIDIALTSLGLGRLNEIILIVFSIISALKEMTEEEFALLHERYTCIEEYAFVNKKTLASPMNELCDYSEYLIHQFPADDTFKGFSHVDKAFHHFREIVGQLNSNNLLVVLTSRSRPDLDFVAESVKWKDSFFNCDITKAPIIPNKITETTHKFSFAVPDGPPKTKTVQDENPLRRTFISRTRDVAPATNPIFHNGVWVASSETGNVSIFFPFDSPGTALTLSAIDVLVDIWGEELKHLTYHAGLMGVSWGMYSNVNYVPSILLHVNGPEPQALRVLTLLRTYIQNEQNHIVTYAQLKRARTLCRARYQSHLELKTVKRVIMASVLTFECELFPFELRVEALEILDLDELKQIASSMITLGVTSLYSGLFERIGNETEHETATLWCSHLLKSGNVTLQLEPQKGDNLHTTFYYIQMGPRSDCLKYTLAKLTEFIVKQSATEKLRDEAQLAYAVLVGLQMYRATFGISICLPSGRANCERLITEIEYYLSDLEDTLMLHSEESFQALLKLFMEQFEKDESKHDNLESSVFAGLHPQQSLGPRPECQDFRTHWNQLGQILLQTYRFNSKNNEEEIDKSVLAELTLLKYMNFFRAHISVDSPTRSTLCINSPACDAARRLVIKRTAEVIAPKLGLTITLHDLETVLEQCSDQIDFSDLKVHLKPFCKASGQMLAYKKLELKFSVGKLLRSGKSKRKIILVPKRVVLTDYKDIQKECMVINVSGERQNLHTI